MPAEFIPNDIIGVGNGDVLPCGNCGSLMRVRQLIDDDGNRHFMFPKYWSIMRQAAYCDAACSLEDFRRGE